MSGIRVRLAFSILLLISARASADDIYMDQTRMALKSHRELFFSLKLNGEESLGRDAVPKAGLGANIEYRFYKTYATGVEFSYKRPFTSDEDYYNGVNDLIFYFTDKELWADHKQKMGLSYKVNAIFPTSRRSQTASLYWGLSESLTFRKRFGMLSFLFSTDLTENFYEYQTADTSGKLPRYNSPLHVGNRAVLNLSVLKELHWQNAASIRTSTDYASRTSNVYSVSTGVAYDIQENATLDLGIRSSMRDTGLRRGRDDNTQTGPENIVVSDRLFDGRGTVIYLGTLLKI